MKRNRGSRIAGGILMAAFVAVLLLAPGAEGASKYKTLQRFTGYGDEHGALPLSGLIFDAAGNLYGTTIGGGTNGSGVVFKLAPNGDGTWRESVLYSFCSATDCSDGARPVAALVFDGAGNLYGTTISGGTYLQGNVFKLASNQDGSWTESVLYSFTGGADGGFPEAALILDTAGNLYSTTVEGGSGFGGTVFRLFPNSDGSWTESVIYNFTGKDGGGPYAGLIFDVAGNLYGTTSGGGVGYGVIFELTPNADGSWRETVLHGFDNGDGAQPVAGLVFDQAGDLYGTTIYGGNVSRGRCTGSGCGVVFKLTPNSNGTWKENVLHKFADGRDGGFPYAGVSLDAAGNVYGTAQFGGVRLCNKGYLGCGVVFQLIPDAKGNWKERVLHTFLDKPGAEPPAGVVLDSAGGLYGTTAGDVGETFGSVFEIVP